MSISHQSIEERIKNEALRLGFSACGIAQAGAVPDEEMARLKQWLEMGMHGNMSYLERNLELRRDPRILLPGTRSVIMLALNYYPEVCQAEYKPQIAYYAYGRDYHKVVKRKLNQLLHFIQEQSDEEVFGRAFADSAPLLERYWAVQAGLGWRGKNGLLIIPQAGSYFVLGALLVSLSLKADEVQKSRCGKCTRCITACPTQALLGGGVMDARRCISYLTIEQKEEIPQDLANSMSNQVFGCDICQKVCPWNTFARANREQDFMPRAAVLHLSAETIEAMTDEEFDRQFAGSAVRRAGLIQLKRNLKALKITSPPDERK